VAAHVCGRSEFFYFSFYKFWFTSNQVVLKTLNCFYFYKIKVAVTPASNHVPPQLSNCALYNWCCTNTKGGSTLQMGAPLESCAIVYLRPLSIIMVIAPCGTRPVILSFGRISIRSRCMNIDLCYQQPFNTRI